MDAFTSSGNYLGTDRLERALTDAESRRLGELLRAHQFVDQSMVALRFAYKLTRSVERSRDLVGRVNLRLVRLGWDPNAVPLVKRLCRLVWSEFTHMVEENDAARRAEDAFLREEEAQGELRHSAPTRGEPDYRIKEPLVPSREQELTRPNAEHEEDARRQRELVEMRDNVVKLRDAFQEKNDRVNLDYLDQVSKGVDDLSQMVVNTGHDAKAFYAAQKRRARAVRSIVAANEGVPAVDEEKE